MVPIFHGRVSDDGERLELEAREHPLRLRYLHGLAGQAVDLVIRQHRNRRTDRQNRYYFGVVVPLIADYCGYERDDMHECLAMKFLRIEDDPITGAPRRRRTPATNTKDFAEYVDSCVRFATELGVYVPAPGEAMPV